MVPPYLYVDCENCRGQIAFPTPSPQEAEDRLRRLSKGTWQIYFQCPHCGHVALHYIQDVHLAQARKGSLDPILRVPPPGPSGFYYRIEHKCGHSNCGLPHVLFLQSGQYQTEKALARMVAMRSGPSTRCSAGHKFEPTFELVSVKEVFSLL